MAPDKLILAVNHAVNDYRIARARMGLLNLGMGLYSKRGAAWCEYGFKEVLGFHDFYNLYRRGGIAHGAVNKMINACWHTNPWVIEGDEQDGAKKETQWEHKLKLLINQTRFWRAVAEADRRRMVGRYSALLIQLRDSGRWDQPVKNRGAAIVNLIPVWAGSIKPTEFNTNAQDEGYGEVIKWEYTEGGLGSAAGRRIEIHPDRVFILGDASSDAIGFLEPAFNSFVSLEKVEGGSGESFLKNAARQVSVDFDKEIDFASLASLYGVSVSDLQEKFNEAAKEINRGNDAMLITQGAAVSPLVSPVSDPTPTYMVNLQTAAAALDIPTRILVGNQSGERASREDREYFNARCQSRRGELSDDIYDLIGHLMRIHVIDKLPEYTVMWDDLTDATQADKLNNAKAMSEINMASLATGEIVFRPDELREAAGYKPIEDEGSLPEFEDEDGYGESSDPAV